MHNAKEFHSLLAGQGSLAKLSMISASAGALLWLGGFAPTLKDASQLAHDALLRALPLALFKKILELNHA